MPLPNYINTNATEPSLARWISLVNSSAQGFPAIFVEDEKSYQWFLHDNGTIESFSGALGYTLRVTIGPIDSGPNGGTYTLTVGETTSPIAWDADAEVVAGALNSLTTVDGLGGVNVSGSFPNFIIYANAIGAFPTITADVSLLSPDSEIFTTELTAGTAQVRQSTQLALRRDQVASVDTWTRITSPYNGWEGRIELDTEGAETLLAQEGEVIGGYYQVETILTLQVIHNGSGKVTTYYQTKCLLRGKNSVAA